MGAHRGTHRLHRYRFAMVVLIAVLAILWLATPASASTSVTLVSGWNLVAAGPGSSFPSTLFGWNGSSYVSTTTPVSWQGYWCKVTQQQTVNLSAVYGPYTTTLATGWNLIGNPTSDPTTLSLPSGLVAFGYDASAASYVSTTSLAPGQGAWVKGAAGATVTFLPPPPTVTALPLVSGTPAVGDTLSCSSGSWQNDPTSFTYQWLRDGSPISGAVQNTYTVQATDAAGQGHGLSCQVTATSSAGHASAVSKGVEVGQVTIVFVNVGYGDATILRCGNWTALIDGGPPTGAQAVENALDDLGVTQIDCLVITHAHDDHIGGLVTNVTGKDGSSMTIIERFKPREYVYGEDPGVQQVPTNPSFSTMVPLDSSVPSWGTVKAQLDDAGAAGQCVLINNTLDWPQPLDASVLSPTTATLTSDHNENSVVIFLQYFGKNILFTGDLLTGSHPAFDSTEQVDNETMVENDLVNSTDVPLDLLKVAHHGNSNATGAAFVDATQPTYSVISGDGTNGSLDTTVIWRLTNLNGGKLGTVSTTKDDGSITVTISPSGQFGH